MKPQRVTIQMKAIELVMHSERIFTFKTVEKTLVFDNLCERYSMVLSISTASEAAKCFPYFLYDFMNFRVNATLDNLYFLRRCVCI